MKKNIRIETLSKALMDVMKGEYNKDEITFLQQIANHFKESTDRMAERMLKK